MMIRSSTQGDSKLVAVVYEHASLVFVKRFPDSLRSGERVVIEPPWGPWQPDRPKDSRSYLQAWAHQ
jgi:hypothetical protein